MTVDEYDVEVIDLQAYNLAIIELPSPGRRLNVTVWKTDDEKFTVQFGERVYENLSRREAAQEIGESLIHRAILLESFRERK